jgi:hypothetical protein
MADREAIMDPQTAHDQFVHVRIIIGIVTGLSVTRLLTALFLADLADSAIKGAQSIFNAFGIAIRSGRLAALALIAAFVTDRRYHGIFVAVAIGAEVYWIASQFAVLE